MSWLTLDLATKIVIPLGTFALGIFVTLWTKHREQQKTDSRIRAAEAAVLLNEWYDQIHELSIDLRYKLKGRARKRAIDSYVGSRRVLPKLIRVRETLARAGDQPDLVTEIDGFLRAVTRVEHSVENANWHLWASDDCRGSVDLSTAGDDWKRYRTGCVPYDAYHSDELLEDLDCRVQTASRLAAKALA